MGELKVSVHDGIALALMSNTRRHNAQDTALHADLCDFWARLRRDDSLQVAVLAGDGETAFSVGADLKEAAEAYGAGEAHNSPRRTLGYPHLHPTGKIVIAAINGYCLAGGLLTALGCDLRFCSASATFANPQVMRGRGSRVPMLLQRAGVPLAVTVDMAITGQAIDARRAYEVGLVSRVYDDKDALIDGAMSVAAQIMENSPRAVSAVKKALEAGILDWPMVLAERVWDQVTDAMTKDADTVRRTIEFASHSGADRHDS
jgi:enoyl-CoA hydratase/carnithine racemase